jgi:hypothetical protein
MVKIEDNVIWHWVLKQNPQYRNWEIFTYTISVCSVCVRYVILNYSFIFCSWLSEVYALDYPCFSAICAPCSTLLPWVIESTLYFVHWMQRMHKFNLALHGLWFFKKSFQTRISVLWSSSYFNLLLDLQCISELSGNFKLASFLHCLAYFHLCFTEKTGAKRQPVSYLLLWELVV